ncbi:hypothetical protein ACFJEF_06040, partial [Streptomyces sp. Sce081]
MADGKSRRGPVKRADAESAAGATDGRTIRMRSARMLLATATATAALAVSAPTAFAATLGDWDHDKSSYSKEHDKDSSHDKPRGGTHTGGG